MPISLQNLGHSYDYQYNKCVLHAGADVCVAQLNREFHYASNHMPSNFHYPSMLQNLSLESMLTGAMKHEASAINK